MKLLQLGDQLLLQLECDGRVTKQDLEGVVAQAVRAVGLRMGLYHSLFEWFNPIFLTDQANNYTTQYYVKDKVTPCLNELVNTYLPDIVWSDGDAGISIRLQYFLFYIEMSTGRAGPRAGCCRAG